MHLLSLAAIAALSCTQVLASKAGDIIPNRYIVEIEQVDGSRSPDQGISDTLNRLRSSTIVRSETRQEFRATQFRGASIQTSENATLESISAIPGVKRVWPVRKVTLPRQPVPSDLGSATAFQRAPITAQQLSNAVPISKFKRGAANDTWSPHVMTQIDQLHAEGITGSGVRVGVIDSGVDYTNPLLGGCFGPGCKISFGGSFVNDEYVDGDAPMYSSDPFVSCSEHGTHVTGIIASAASPYGFVGASPDAEIGHYRVFGCDGGSGDDVIMAAMLKAAEDKVNVINMSLGGNAGWLDGSPLQRLVNTLADENIVVVSSAGNERTEGLFYASAPAAATKGISAASVDVEILPSYIASAGGSNIPILSVRPFLAGQSLTVTFPSPQDACSQLPPTKNQLVIVERGTCTFVQKMQNIAAAGGRYALIYNSATAGPLPYLDPAGTGLSGVAGLRREDGLKLLALYKSNSRLRISFTAQPSQDTVNTQSGGLVSSYSSFGPTNELVGAVSFSAPGGSILSTVPLALGGINVLSGTSMSAPLMSGAVALLLSARKSDNLTPQQVRLLLGSTAKKTPTKRGGSVLDTAAIQGAGLIQVADAVRSRTLISPPELLLNDTQHVVTTHKITITNSNDFSAQFSFSSRAGQGVATYDAGETLPSLKPQELSAATAKVAFGSRAITIAAGQSAVLTVTITPPSLAAADSARLPIYSGWIEITQRATNGVAAKTHSVPYFGAAGNMLAAPVLDRSSVFAEDYVGAAATFPLIEDNSGSVQASDDSVKSFQLRSGVHIVSRLAMGSREVLYDAVEASAGQTGPVTTSIPTIGRIERQELVARDSALTDPDMGFTVQDLRWRGVVTDSNGATTTSVGINRPVRVLIRALKIFGDPANAGDYDSWLSPAFQLTK